jgi:uncharacterized protein
MRRLLVAATLSLGMTFAVLGAAPAFADGDPTMSQIYAAAEGGHLDQAQQMITQVLADRPNSAKAHYVQAELYAKEGKTPLARSELGTAERLNPGLTDFSQRSVQELKSQLGLSVSRPLESERAVSFPTRSATHFPWGTLLILAGVVAVLLMVFRRRNTYNQYPSGAGPGMGGAPGANYGPGPGYGPGPMGGGGIGSGIAGGLASGLAVGAGVVAGEELAHHFLDGGHRDGGVIPSADAAEPGYSNSDMGGSNFGSNDSGGWDDSGGGGGGGGDDWS